jgi:hypothetical protein
VASEVKVLKSFGAAYSVNRKATLHKKVPLFQGFGA